MEFLYRNDIDTHEIQQCPPLDAQPVSLLAWRWTFEPYTANCFSPLGKVNPKRILSPTITDKCSCWGLSMYSTQDKAESVFSEIEKNFKKARQTIGTHVSKGNLEPEDGVITEIEDNGHFDFHPYTGVDIKLKFEVVRCIP
ncbi:hypothetical protein [Serratia sp. 4542]|uniref:hypothetical protein n=1 Tax=Serratia sp. 4542 TaxID=2496797 RepID=UPI00193133EF|nr:hypothetical protein [Serratia sp. 4542]MBM0400892.1 hypothetical protein [Serratia sp. 4542]